MKSAFFALPLALLLGACAQAPQSLNKQAPSRACCERVEQLASSVLLLNKTHYVTLDGSAQHLAPHSEQPVRLVALPQSEQPYLLEVQALIQNLQGLAPRLSLLDEDFQQTRQLNRDAFSYRPAHLSAPDLLHARVLIQNSGTQRERYLLIDADPSAINENLQLVHPDAQYAERNNLIAQHHLPIVATLGNMGVVKLNAANTLSLERALSGLNTPSAPATVEPPSKANTDTRRYYLDAMRKALDNGNYKQAAALAEQAEQAGIADAKAQLVELLK